ncbi:MBL fold metallo-hydrolase [Lysinibacillus boronitolerans]|uniref:MBL fold metallo-hydrolase n=1 Tax=Lysinibacillus boronitolerans TaxID=309788 RepID=UPI002163B5FD|nr:MBL fold metallo-hydrolase [Lysinibacillus boronitolerans]MCS1391374.1 MBL fold metallo-hydrolase [Lysinibacillus boronitolerans]
MKRPTTVNILDCGRIRFKGDSNWMPVQAFLIQTPEVNIVVDAGFHPDIITNTKGYLGMLSSVVEIEVTKENLIDHQIKQHNLEVSNIDKVIYSHLHFDHCGGAVLFEGKTTEMVQLKEFESAHNAHFHFEYNKKDIDYAKNFKKIKGDLDLLGNGEIHLIETPGHSAGHQSVWIENSDDSDILLLCDASYSVHQFIHRGHSKYPFKKELEIVSINRLHNMIENRNKPVCVYAGHDPIPQIISERY